MNERIKELAKQAFIYSCEFAHDPDYSPHNPYNGLIEKERYDTKFAELIIQECIDIISPYTVRMSRPGEKYLHPIQEIRKNFGVEA